VIFHSYVSLPGGNINGNINIVMKTFDVLNGE
jgi:hypothetical protein